MSVELPNYFSEQFAHAGDDSPHVVNTQPNLNVSLCTNDSSGSSGNSGSGTTDGYHDHANCFCSHENTVDMPASANQKNPCCLCGNNNQDAACINCDCQMHDNCLVETNYHSVLPNNESLNDSSDSGEAPSGSDNGEDSSGSDNVGADSGSDEESNNGNNGNNN